MFEKNCRKWGTLTHAQWGRLNHRQHYVYVVGYVEPWSMYPTVPDQCYIMFAPIISFEIFSIPNILSLLVYHLNKIFCKTNKGFLPYGSMCPTWWFNVPRAWGRLSHLLNFFLEMILILYIYVILS